MPYVRLALGFARKGGDGPDITLDTLSRAQSMALLSMAEADEPNFLSAMWVLQGNLKRREIRLSA